jgi:MerR family copper efflux transcriptional regulator
MPNLITESRTAPRVSSRRRPVRESSVRPTREALLRIGELARKSGVSIDTIRFYERQHLLHASVRAESGYRYYTPTAVTQLKFIRNAKSLGFSLKEIGTLLELTGDDSRSNQGVLKILSRKVNALEQRINRMIRARKALQRLLENKDGWQEIRRRGGIDQLTSLIATLDIDKGANPDGNGTNGRTQKRRRVKELA